MADQLDKTKEEEEDERLAILSLKELAERQNQVPVEKKETPPAITTPLEEKKLQEKVETPPAKTMPIEEKRRTKRREKDKQGPLSLKELKEKITKIYSGELSPDHPVFEEPKEKEETPKEEISEILEELEAPEDTEEDPKETEGTEEQIDTEETEDYSTDDINKDLRMLEEKISEQEQFLAELKRLRDSLNEHIK